MSTHPLPSTTWCILRPWLYNPDVSEYYVILEDKSILKRIDATREIEETELEEPQLHVLFLKLYNEDNNDYIAERC